MTIPESKTTVYMRLVTARENPESPEVTTAETTGNDESKEEANDKDAEQAQETESDSQLSDGDDLDGLSDVDSLLSLSLFTDEDHSKQPTSAQSPSHGDSRSASDSDEHGEALVVRRRYTFTSSKDGTIATIDWDSQSDAEKEAHAALATSFKRAIAEELQVFTDIKSWQSMPGLDEQKWTIFARIWSTVAEEVAREPEFKDRVEFRFVSSDDADRLLEGQGAPKEIWSRHPWTIDPDVLGPESIKWVQTKHGKP